MKKKFLIVITTMLIMTILPIAAYGTSEDQLCQGTGGAIVPQFVGMTEYITGFNIVSGLASCTTIVYASESKVDTVNFKMNLQRCVNGSWITIKSWSKSEPIQYSSALISENYSVTQGYKYRFTVTIKTYKNGVLLDNVLATSTEKTY
ncbi:MAG: hypothetical protein ACOX4U_04235 [Anaerovoracaceae bacterium]